MFKNLISTDYSTCLFMCSVVAISELDGLHVCTVIQARKQWTRFRFTAFYSNSESFCALTIKESFLVVRLQSSKLPERVKILKTKPNPKYSLRTTSVSVNYSLAHPSPQQPTP